MIIKPNYSEVPGYYHYYLNLVVDNNLINALQKSCEETLQLIDSITTEKENYSYAERKWTTKEVLRHIIDCERVFAYRAFRFSRFDNSDLAIFDENQYISNSQTIQWDLEALKNEYTNVRKSTINLFMFMTEGMLDFKGTVNKTAFTARAIGYMLVGHNIHHNNIIKKHYL